MLAIVLSLLFGFIAFATLAELYASITQAAHRRRLILEELARFGPVRAATVSRKPTLPRWEPPVLPRLAAA